MTSRALQSRVTRYLFAATVAFATANSLGACAIDASDSLEASTRAIPHDALKSTVYPIGPYGFSRGDVIADASFEGVDKDGELTTLHLHDAYTKTASSGPRILVIAVTGGLWCGTCQWFGKHGEEIIDPADERLLRLDLVVGNRDNAPASGSDARAWQRTFGLTTSVGADPTFFFGAAREGGQGALPLFVFVDRRSMRLLDVLSNPDDDTLRSHLASALSGAIDTESTATPAKLIDWLFHQNEWELLQETSVPDAPPADPTNRFADDPRAAALGKELFFDAGLSPSGKVACATCHDPKKAYSDGLSIARGARSGTRRTPSIALSAHARWQFWDGRANTLWAQALGPIENDAELASSRSFVARYLVTRYGDALKQTFGEDLTGFGSWPSMGKPGDAKYDALPARDQATITRLFVDAGKAIEAYERTFRVAPNALDSYLAGHFGAITPEEKYGLELFVHEGCMQCHWGPRLTDDAFHDTRIPGALTRHSAPDRGRADGLVALATSEFRADGPWSDEHPRIDGEGGVESSDRAQHQPDRSIPPSTVGQFKTPALRGAGELAFFGHSGAFHDLSGVAEMYGQGGVPMTDASTTGTRDAWLPTFGETAEWGLVPFLRSLKAEPIGNVKVDE